MDAMAENLSLAEIFAWLRKRDTSALPETTRTMILEAWHTGRLPLVADKVREFRCACPVPPHTWVPEPAPDDEKAKRYVEELRKTQIVGYLPATAAQTTVTLEKVLFNQMVPGRNNPIPGHQILLDCRHCRLAGSCDRLRRGIFRY
jgi:hypothetical protein